MSKESQPTPGSTGIAVGFHIGGEAGIGLLNLKLRKSGKREGNTKGTSEKTQKAQGMQIILLAAAVHPFDDAFLILPLVFLLGNHPPCRFP
jgi:hypothetical protein